jgi:FAD/FMN-containing dehydrogenase
MISDIHINALTEILGAKGAIADAQVLALHLEEWRGKFFGKTQLMIAPDSAETAVKAVEYCHHHHIALVPQGGNTGLVGGSLPGLADRDEILLSTKRMRRELTVDTENLSITADAGFTVAEIQKAAADKGLLFPLSLASEGSCTVGGIISTNAGGVHVIRYGSTRALTLGLQAILPTGVLYDGLTALRKDNTGYDLTQLLVGAEGSLGLVTKAVFKLFPAEIQRHTAWLSVPSPDAAISLLKSARTATGDRVSVFEIMPQQGLQFVLKHIANTRNPIEIEAPWFLLLEVASSCIDTALEDTLQSWLATQMENGQILDGTLAVSEKQRLDFWRLRESMSEAQKHEGGSIKHDISVPVSAIPAFIEETTTALEGTYSGCRVTPFGHVGDGNLHFNVMQPQNADKVEYLSRWEEMNQLVHDLTTKYGGSISAEHGIGSLKKAELARTKSVEEIAAMQAIKNALDPHNIMNPGVIFD